MPHMVFKQPNGKYGVWSTVVDAPLIWNASKKGVMEHEGISAFKFDHICRPFEEAVGEGGVECCLYNGNWGKPELLDFFEDIGYTGPLVDHAKEFVPDYGDEEEN